MPLKGKVYLVGAGAGDLGLMTVKSLELIGKADVILYDKLIPNGALKNARPDAELIYVGKQAGKHSMPQQDINNELIKYANQGKNVVRLKGGDPFVFGRGGEEAIDLFDAGIEFEVVPGTTSGASVPAYAGIPITHRGIATSAHFITGHEDPEKAESQINYEALAKLHGTLVFYMGVGNLGRHIDQLMKNGKSGDTPSAVIHYGCTPHQKTVTGKMSEIENIAKDAGIKPPSIIVIGDVCGLRYKLNWYEKLPLFGKSVVVTRATTQASKLALRLTELGAEVIELSSISIEASNLTESDSAMLKSMHEYDWVIFTSQNAVDATFEQLENINLDARSFASVKIASIGGATTEALRKKGLIADLMSRKFTSSGLIDTFKSLPESERGKRVLLPRADIASDELPNGLTQLGIESGQIDIYKTVIAKPDAEIIDRVVNQKPDYFTFTSASTAENMSKLIGSDVFVSLSNRSRFVSIGPVTSAKLKELGANISIEADISNIDGLINTLIEDGKGK